MVERAHVIPSLVVVLALVLAVGVSSQPSSSSIVIRGVRLIDGTGAPPRENVTVVTEGAKIAAVGADAEVRVPAGATIIDGGGKTLLPGLIDTHVHFRDYVAELFLAHGVTTVRDAGNPPEWILALKKLEAEGSMRGPRIYAVGNILDAPPVQRGHHIAVATPAEARQAARELLAKGVDGIKVYEQLTPDLLRPIAEEAHAAGRRVIGHITFSARDAALAGIDALEHASGIALAIASDPDKVRAIDGHEGVFGWRYMDPRKADEVAALLVERRVAVVPALASWARGAPLRAAFQKDAARVLSDPGLSYLPDDSKLRPNNYAPSRPEAETRALADDYTALGDFLRRFHRAGGRTVVGTDGGVLQGLSVHHELQLLVDVGLTPVEAIRSATGHAAELIGAKELGTIAPGQAADLLLVNGDPSRAIGDTRKIAAVIKRGEHVDTRFHADYRIPIKRPPVAGSRP